MKKLSEKLISDFAYISLKKEVEATPKPGLVDRENNGSHTDMDINTFYRSIDAIYKYFGKFYSIGSSTINYEKKFELLRKVGKYAEKEMYIATDNVNTHKGIIFSLGIISFAVGLLDYENKNYEIIDILHKASEVSKNIAEELKVENPKTYGEILYSKYRIKGIRGEAEEGFIKSYNIGLSKFYKNREFLNENDLLVHILIYFMSELTDTNILGRKSLFELDFVIKCSKKAIDLGGMKTEEGRNYIENLNDIFVMKNISPGGSADYLTITYFLYLIKEYLNI